MSPAQVVILAAGLGTRLGRSLPKPLTVLGDGRTIMQQQLDNIATAFGDSARITAVVGFKMDLIMERFPDILYAYNQDYDQTNTSKSLLKALRLSHDGGVLWFNGDVVFDAAILDRVTPMMKEDQSFVCVNTAAVDPLTKSVLINSEDGMLYRWDLATNAFTQKIALNGPLGQAYTPTVVGADGAVYAVNNATVYAIGR